VFDLLWMSSYHSISVSARLSLAVTFSLAYSRAHLPAFLLR
jgi:hypothetical protein